MAETTRAEHLAWCKRRALEYVDRDDLDQAFNSMGSDLNKHPETLHHSGMLLGTMMRTNGFLDDPAAMRKFINGFN